MLVKVSYLSIDKNHDIKVGNDYKIDLVFSVDTYNEIFTTIASKIHFLYLPEYLEEYLKDNELQELNEDYLLDIVMENNMEDTTDIILSITIDNKLIFEDNY